MTCRYNSLVSCNMWGVRSIGHLFDVAKATVCRIVHNTCRAIVDVLLIQYIHFPNTMDEINKVVNGFKTKFGMIQCLGSVDGSHIPVMPPALNYTDYYNIKGYYSMTLLAVDHNYMFQDINIGWPGSVRDARVFANSSVYHKAIY